MVICQEQNLLTATSWVLCRTWQRSWEKTVIKEDRKHFLLISYLLFYFILRSYPRRILFSLAERRDMRFQGHFQDHYLNKEQLDLVQLSSFQTSLVNLTLTYNFLHGTFVIFVCKCIFFNNEDRYCRFSCCSPNPFSQEKGGLGEGKLKESSPVCSPAGRPGAKNFYPAGFAEPDKYS